MVLIWLCHNKRLKFTQATLRRSLAFFPPSSFPSASLPSSSPSSLLCVSRTSPLFPSFPSFQPSPLRRCSKMTCVCDDDLSSGTTPPPFYPLTFTTSRALSRATTPTDFVCLAHTRATET